MPKRPANDIQRANKKRHIENTDINANLWRPVNDVEVLPNIQNLEYNKFVSATQIKHYLLRDPSLDWYHLYYHIHGLGDRRITRNSVRKRITDELTADQNNVLFEKGNTFERKVFEEIYHRFPDQYILIAPDGRNDMNRQNYIRTISAMKEGIPFILQAVVYNDRNMTGGMIDILIRSDYINKLVNRREIDDEESSYKAPYLTGNYHYRVIDIKWTTMSIRANHPTLCNDDRFPAYKGQLAIYTSAIGQIQGYTPTMAYILAKHWKITSKIRPQEGFNCFDLLGHVDYTDWDNKYIRLTADAIRWVRHVRRDGSSWSPINPQVEEMYPNISNTNDAPWGKIKAKVANEIGEITKIYYAGYDGRVNAHKNGIMSIHDTRLTSAMMGKKDGNISRVIDRILEVNHRNDVKLLPKRLRYNMNNWHEVTPIDFSVDFEFLSLPLQRGEIDIHNSFTETQLINMIGVGWHVNDEWRYRVFTIDRVSLEEETRIIDEFTRFILTKSAELDPRHEHTPRLFHWSPAEKSVFNIANQRNNLKWTYWDQNIEWIDLCKVFTTEPITIKGAYRFKLKEIGRAMYNHGMIPTLWDDNGPSEGLSAMIGAMDYYENKKRGIDNVDIINSIIKYNEIDCKVVLDIVKYLRTHHLG